MSSVKLPRLSAFVLSGTTGHEGGNMLVRKTLKEINEMFAEE